MNKGVLMSEKTKVFVLLTIQTKIGIKIKMTSQQTTAKTKRGDLTSAEREMLQVAAAGISQGI